MIANSCFKSVAWELNSSSPIIPNVGVAEHYKKLFIMVKVRNAA